MKFVYLSMACVLACSSLGGSAFAGGSADLHEYLIHGWFTTAPNTGDSQASCVADAAAMLDTFTKATGIQGATANCDEVFSGDEDVVLGSTWKGGDLVDTTEPHRVTANYITLSYKARNQLSLYEAHYGRTDDTFGGKSFASYYECETEANKQKPAFEAETGLKMIGARCVADVSDDAVRGKPLSEQRRSYALTLYGYDTQLKNVPAKALYSVSRGMNVFGSNITTDPVYRDKIIAGLRDSKDAIAYQNSNSPLYARRQALATSAGLRVPSEDTVIVYYRSKAYNFRGVGTIARFDTAETCESQLDAVKDIYSKARSFDGPAFKSISVTCELPSNYRNMDADERTKIWGDSPIQMREMDVVFLSEGPTFYTEVPNPEVGNYLSFDKCVDSANKSRVISNYGQSKYYWGTGLGGMICEPAPNHEKLKPLDQQFQPLLFRLSN